MRGIGRAIALRLAEDGADVVVTAAARDPASFPQAERDDGWQGIESVADEITAFGTKSISIDVDVTKPEQVREAHRADGYASSGESTFSSTTQDWRSFRARRTSGRWMTRSGGARST